MIAFRGHRGGSGAPATLAPPEASPWRVSPHRHAALEPSGGREKRPYGRPCRLLRSRRAALVKRPPHGGPRSGPENLQSRQMCHPSMKVSTRLYPAGRGRHSGIVRPPATSPARTQRRVFT